LVELYQVVRIAHDDWKRGKKVLIRCQAGWNRSGLIMALVLMREGYTADEAINLIRQKRSPHALCNKGFENWLRSLPAQE
jgi:protein-tyrosine phosphatase